MDQALASGDGERVVYLAGGCFWGMEKLMRSLCGVTDVVCGYANGHADAPTYREVCAGGTGCREAVRVTYDSRKTSLEAILFAYFAVVDPAAENRQGNDIGPQYQAGVYYADEESRLIVQRVAELERKRAKAFHVEIAPLTRFYMAEEDHQRYLDKHPGGYCHISPDQIKALAQSAVDPAAYARPAQETLRKRLTREQYAVTQEDATEPPFRNAYWDGDARGIYVDVATGEPLFCSTDKFDSGCGWPAFSAPIDPCVVRYREDRSLGAKRIEVRSRAGNSHLGHVFYGEASAPGGVRYCINSAALRFIPYERMEAEGYGFLMKAVRGNADG